MKTIQFEVDEGGIALLSIDINERTVNLLTAQFQADLADAIERVATDPAIKGVVITSSKVNGFLADADLEELVDAYGRDSLQQACARSAQLSGVFRRIETCGKPVACAINGAALGGGLELALACHYRTLLDDPEALVGLPEVKVGLLPGAGGTQRLPRLIGIPSALQVMLQGNPLRPAKALELGMVNEVLPAHHLIARAREWVLSNPGAVAPWDVKGFKPPGGVGCQAPHAAESFQAATSRQAHATQRNYPAPLAILSAVFEGTQVPIDTGLRIESKYFAKLLTGPVARNLMRTSFINKRVAEKLMRRPSGVAKSRVKQLGVIGAGMMGAGIAYTSAAAFIKVVLLDVTIEAAEKGKCYSATLLKRDLKEGRTTREKMDTLLAHITPTTDYTLLADCDLVIEAVFEDREVKREVTQMASAVLARDAIFASNTSTLTIGSLARAFPYENRFIGIHFFSPVERMPLVEIIRGSQTSEQTLATALDFAAQLRKTPIVVNDSPGFFTSRVFGTFVDEGMAMLSEGIEPALIENAARFAGMPMGPLAITDEVTLDLQLKVHEQAVADGLAPAFQRLTGIDVIQKMVKDARRTGRRDGGGFYDYPAGGRKHLWPGLGKIFPVTTQQPDVEELKTRLLYIQALESARCVEEGVITHPADADLGSVLGIGYPSWTGGTLSYIETVGLARFVAECHRLSARYGHRFEPSNALTERARLQHLYYRARNSVPDVRPGHTRSVPAV
jgi:3-hydroxyacyl-CoA dehydrogenase/enoyl-CoA hydratase/3-hydroxybutyryl-CoA epimerase